jgi:hypothetical protein
LIDAEPIYHAARRASAEFSALAVPLLHAVILRITRAKAEHGKKQLINHALM